MLQIAKHPSRIQQAKNFPVERALPFMHQVMNGKAGNHRVKGTKRRQGRVHVMVNDADPRILGKTLSRCLQHGR